MQAFARIGGRIGQIALAVLALGYVALGLHFQLKPPLLYVLYAALLTWAVCVTLLVWRGRWSLVWGFMAGLVTIWGLWWATIEPRQDRDWMSEVSRGVTSTPAANGRITLYNIRDFRWSSPTEAEQVWYDLEVDPQSLTSVDMILSVWDHPDIAHTLVSFGFEDGRHIVFSGEIRKEKGEEFSNIGGLFKSYEVVLIAADERDIVNLRTNARGETVSLYPVALSDEQRLDLFRALLDYGNALAERPRWYHTLWTNCTTLPYRLVRGITDGAPFDLRIILSGRLPGYLYDLGVLPGAGAMPLSELRERAALPTLDVAGMGSAPYSKALRQGWQD